MDRGASHAASDVYIRTGDVTHMQHGCTCAKAAIVRTHMDALVHVVDVWASGDVGDLLWVSSLSTSSWMVQRRGSPVALSFHRIEEQNQIQ